MNENNIKGIIKIFAKEIIAQSMKKQAEIDLKNLCDKIKNDFGVEIEFNVDFVVTKIDDSFFENSKKESADDVLTEVFNIINKK